LVLYPGALVITCLAPISAQLLQRNLVSAKTLVLMSLAAGATAMFLFSNMNLDADGGHFRWIRSMQGFGYGLFLVPVNLIAYSQLRPDQNNKASSLTNLFRNWGGSFGIAFVTTAAERRAELHQLNLGSNVGSSSQALHDNSAGLIQQLMQHGLTSADAGTATLGIIYRQLLQQSEFLAFMDCFRVFAWLSLVMIPVVILVRRSKAGAQPTAGH
jgi:DHA2 family multidrug resistance protein